MDFNLTERGKRIFFTTFVVAFVNFTVFFFVAVNIGGDAMAGKIEKGRYYVSNHGELTEVSRAVYIYSYIHEVSVMITHPSVFIAAGYLIWTGDIKLHRRARSGSRRGKL